VDTETQRWVGLWVSSKTNNILSVSCDCATVPALVGLVNDQGRVTAQCKIFFDFLGRQRRAGESDVGRGGDRRIRLSLLLHPQKSWRPTFCSTPSVMNLISVFLVTELSYRTCGQKCVMKKG
jgi:hypothetical protein